MKKERGESEKERARVRELVEESYFFFFYFFSSLYEQVLFFFVKKRYMLQMVQLVSILFVFLPLYDVSLLLC